RLPEVADDHFLEQRRSGAVQPTAEGIVPPQTSVRVADVRTVAVRVVAGVPARHGLAAGGANQEPGQPEFRAPGRAPGRLASRQLGLDALKQDKGNERREDRLVGQDDVLRLAPAVDDGPVVALADLPVPSPQPFDETAVPALVPGGPADVRRIGEHGPYL